MGHAEPALVSRLIASRGKPESRNGTDVPDYSGPSREGALRRELRMPRLLTPYDEENVYPAGASPGHGPGCEARIARSVPPAVKPDDPITLIARNRSREPKKRTLRNLRSWVPYRGFDYASAQGWRHTCRSSTGMWRAGTGARCKYK
jgi:hypothetical protein